MIVAVNGAFANPANIAAIPTTAYVPWLKACNPKPCSIILAKALPAAAPINKPGVKLPPNAPLPKLTPVAISLAKSRTTRNIKLYWPIVIL